MAADKLPTFEQMHSFQEQEPFECTKKQYIISIISKVYWQYCVNFKY